jgi:tetratricopeptide (TPR) repeat protein
MQNHLEQISNVHSNEVKYDAFISYRREGGSETSRSIKESLEKRGVKVFLDFDELKTGRFDEKLLQVIKETPNFLFILSESALDRCQDPNDWVTQEISQALLYKKNVIPIKKKGFDFSKSPVLPDTIKDLTKFNAINYDDNYYNAFIDELCNRMGKGEKSSSMHFGSTRQDRQKAYDIALIGKQLLKQGKYEEASNHFIEARSLDIDSNLVYIGLGLIELAKGGEPDEILSLFQRSMSLDPASAFQKYAYSQVAHFLGYFKVAIDTLKSGLGNDPTNEEYRILLESWINETHQESCVPLTSLIGKNEESLDLARKLIELENDRLPSIQWWIAFLPPWSLLKKHKFLYSVIFCLSAFLIVLVSNINGLTQTRVLQLINITLLCFLGLWAPGLFSGFLTELYENLRAVVSIPQSTFRRWFLSECIPFSGPLLVENNEHYSMLSLLRSDKFNYGAFIISFLLFFPFQTACALGFDSFKPDLAHFASFSFYYLEIYLLAWIPPFVVRALAFIPGFVRLPIRYFVGAPDSISLKPLGTFYLKIAALGAIAFTLFTIQHYLFRTHTSVTIASIGFIILVYSLFFAVMFFTQALIMMSLAKLRQQVIVDYSYNIEEAYKSFLENPSQENFTNVKIHRKQLKYLKRELSIAGLPRTGYLLFFFLSFFEIFFILIYFYLVINNIWI